ncbi:DHA2 family efflux MFS transporter permease subunit [Siculibacillus lacustris]|uniref:DHA2 family efflux MFS transporter permease subunit n=1 Tax=Siculibacillus lacustris TaxID=1549641 RepID=A0A4Q9VPQ4_9HYPH|nr:DHA2 family efflux MFS transporter permease subunit [Siculibacillus lacustris]
MTVCLMMATIMQALDTTIANVALPYMQGSLSATQDQVNWVLTSYIVSAAIMTAPVGWLAMRFGTKRVLIVCAVGFTVASMLCGLAQSLTDMVLFRLLQGIFGAALVPLSQAVMMAIYPPERRGQAMAIWGMGVMLGPILGPTLGAWLTETWTWRWVFFVNLPFGIATVLGLIAFMKETDLREGHAFDWFGFAMLSLGIGALQLMLDRGETLGWFESPEVVAEAACAVAGLYFFLAHSLTTAKPFIPIAMFADRNFTIGVIFMFLVGMILLATLALVTPYLQLIVGYPVLDSGFLLGSRGVGTLISMMVVGRLLRFMDARILVFFGIVASTWATWSFVWLAPETSALTFVVSNIVQGIGLGLLFVPLNTIAFATLPAALRTEATAVWSLIRNIGSAIGVSIVVAQLTSGTTVMHARLGEALTPWNLGLADPAAATLRGASAAGRATLDAMVTGQAALISYSNDFLLMALVGLATFPLLLLLQDTRAAQMSGGESAPALD